MSHRAPSTRRLETCYHQTLFGPAILRRLVARPAILTPSCLSSGALVRPRMASKTPQALALGKLEILFRHSGMELGSSVSSEMSQPVAWLSPTRPRHPPTSGSLAAEEHESRTRSSLPRPGPPASGNSRLVWTAPPSRPAAQPPLLPSWPSCWVQPAVPISAHVM